MLKRNKKGQFKKKTVEKSKDTCTTTDISSTLDHSYVDTRFEDSVTVTDKQVAQADDSYAPNAAYSVDVIGPDLKWQYGRRIVELRVLAEGLEKCAVCSMGSRNMRASSSRWR